MQNARFATRVLHRQFHYIHFLDKVKISTAKIFTPAKSRMVWYIRKTPKSADFGVFDVFD